MWTLRSDVKVTVPALVTNIRLLPLQISSEEALAGLTSVDPIMYPRGLLPTDLAGGQEEGETLGQVLVPLLTQPLADLAFDLVLVDHRPRVLGHVESSPVGCLRYSVNRS